jgi:hypothetical protein
MIVNYFPEYSHRAFNFMLGLKLSKTPKTPLYMQPSYYNKITLHI